MSRKFSVVLGRQGTVDERFWIKVRRGPDGCFHWIGALNAGGYAMFGVPGRGSKRAARWAYERFVGPIVPGLVIDHLCRNKACVNPKHMEPVTVQENRRRQHLAWLASRPVSLVHPTRRPARNRPRPVAGEGCAWCGGSLPLTGRSDQRFCSASHRQSMWRWRRSQQAA